MKGYRHRVKEDIKLFKLSVHIKRNVRCIFHNRRKKREPISILAYIEIMVNAHYNNLLFKYDKNMTCYDMTWTRHEMITAIECHTAK